MLIELKRRLREISDLNAADDVLNWDQATYMPEGGAGARGRQRAMLNRLAHERAVAPALGTLIDALHALGLVQYLRSIGYEAWIEDADGNEIEEMVLKKAIKPPGPG